jgi:hypothetical protein
MLGMRKRLVLRGALALTQAVMPAVAPAIASAAPLPRTAPSATWTVPGDRWDSAAALRALTPPTDPVLQVGSVQIKPYGASEAAIEEVTRLVRTLAVRPDVQRRLAAARVVVVLIPQDRRMTDLREFSHLRRIRTFDGRTWESVRGMGATQLRDGRTAVGMPVEELDPALGSSWPAGYSVGLHEFAHVVHLVGVSPAERSEIRALFRARRSADGPWTDRYASETEAEYFAQGSMAYFGRNVATGANNGPDWLRENDPGLFRLLERVYGAPSEAGAAVT